MPTHDPSSGDRPELNNKLVLAGILALAVAATFLNSFPGAFHYDDFALFLENPSFREPVFQPESLVTLYAGRPLTLLSLELDLNLFAENPLGFHLVNLLIHIATVILLFLLFSRIISSHYPAFLCALLFAVHPIQAQAVNYIWNRSVLLSTLFLLPAFWAGLERRQAWLPPAFFQLAVWSRMDALAVLPLLLALGGRSRKPLLAIGSLNLLAAGYSLWSTSDNNIAWNHPDIPNFFLTAPVNLFRYLELILHPDNYSIYHAYPEPGMLRIAAASAASIAAIWIILKHRNSAPEVFIGATWMLVMLLPSLLVPNPDPVNEGRAYPAMAGAALLLGSSLVTAGRSVGNKLRSLAGFQSGKTWIRILSALLPLALIPYLAMLTMERNKIWNDDIKIWEEAVQLNPEEHLPLYNLGVALARKGDMKRGIELLERAIALHPGDDMSYAAIGYCYSALGNQNQAVQYFSQALKINPDNREARKGLERLAEGEKKP